MIITKEEFMQKKGSFAQKIKEGAIFIYPTDTIYGIGCSAKNKEAVAKIREIKKRPLMPFSIIAPSKEWIRQNCVVKEKWLEKLPGPVTLIVESKNKEAIVRNVVPNIKTLGVRILDHWISKVIEEIGIPIITTSVNKHGEKNMVCVNDLSEEIKEHVTFIINEGIKEGRASIIVNTITGEVTER